MDRNWAETVALEALGWLVGNEELLPVFLGSSGVSVEQLRHDAGSSDVLAAVLDFITMDDAWVLAFAQSTGTAPEAPMRARTVLAGTSETHWT